MEKGIALLEVWPNPSYFPWGTQKLSKIKRRVFSFHHHLKLCRWDYLFLSYVSFIHKTGPIRKARNDASNKIKSTQVKVILAVMKQLKQLQRMARKKNIVEALQLLCNCFSCFTTAMITFTSALSPQLWYIIYIINTSVSIIKVPKCPKHVFTPVI